MYLVCTQYLAGSPSDNSWYIRECATHHEAVSAVKDMDDWSRVRIRIK